MARLSKAIVLGVLVGVLGLVASPFPLALDIEEDAGLGLLFRTRGARQAPSDVVVISIDRESSESLGLPDNPDKWPRSLHARLTETLMRAGARVVAFDVHFIEPRSEKDDRYFAGAMRKACNVVLCEPIRTKDIPLESGGGASSAAGHSVVQVVPPIDLFRGAAVATAPFTLPRIPFKVNRYCTFEPGAGDAPVMPVVALQLFAREAYGEFVRLLETASPRHVGALPRDLDAAIRSGNVRELMRKTRAIFEGDPSLADRMRKEAERPERLAGAGETARLVNALIRAYEDPNNRYINYYGPPRTVPTIPYHQALRLGDAAGNNPVDLRNKAVFVGLSEALLAERKDSFYTVFSQANGVFIGGVEIAATALSNLLENTPVKPVGLPAHVAAILVWGLVLGILCRTLPVGVAALGTVVLSALYFAAAHYQFRTSQLWLPIAVPLFFQAPLAFFGGVIWNHVDARKEHRKIRKAVESYLPKDVVDQLVKNLGSVGTSSQTVYGVCLFTDAEHFTDLSESLEPAELAAFMNRYFEALFRPVKQHGGVVSNLAGDSMLAVWVANRPEASLRAKACQAAVEIRKAAQNLYDPSDPLHLKTRIGLHYGSLFLGDIGGGDQYRYSAMGDIVNTASRIEGMNKFLGTRLLVSDEVIEHLEGFLARDLGSFRLKGKTRPIGIYELICRIEEADPRQRAACGTFAEALAAFKARSWEEAIEKFRRSAEAFGEDEPSRFYIGLCERYRMNPPGEPWDGAVHMESK